MDLIPKDSELRKVPLDTDRRTILFLDGIRYSIQSFEIASRRLAQALSYLSNSRESDDDVGEAISAAILDAWSIIDSVHRLRELLGQMPGLKKNTPELQLFFRRTSAVEKLRHFFQHFRNEIDSFVEKAMPLWGSIYWSTHNPETGLPETHAIVPGTYFDGALTVFSTFDSREGKFSEGVVLRAGPKSVDLVDLEDVIADFVRWYANWYSSKFPEKSTLGADVHMRLILKPIIS